MEDAMIRKMQVLVTVTLLLLLVACGAPPTPTIEEEEEEGAPPPTVTVDPSISPAVEELPGFEDGEPRPVAATTDADGETAEFVANELWLSADDPDALEGLVARWDGEVLLTFEPEEYGLEDAELPTQYLVRVDASTAATEELGQDVRSLDDNVTGDYAVSSEQGLQLLTAAADEAASGRAVGINWVGSGASFRDGESLESSTGPGSSYDRDAFTWPSHATGTNQDIGVAEAWRAMDLAGRLSNRIGLAVLDMGFTENDDVAADFAAISNVPFVKPLDRENIATCTNGSECPWHGTWVSSAAMAVPDNEFGSAGPAGPVARPIKVFTLYDFFTSITALGEAKLLGARVANMSYGAPVPDYVAWSASPFDAATAAFRAGGLLMFASAGNKGDYVNAERCFGIGRFKQCWEKRFYTPCQNNGVICVGGTEFDGLDRHPNSNHGESVRIYAPYPVWLGPDPDSAPDLVQQKNGTSYSSPFVAGVAALAWAADPSLSANEVQDLLMSTAHDSPDPDVPRSVNALGAVHTALGNVPPALEIVSPDDGADVRVSRSTSLFARTDDLEDGEDCCTVTWESDVDGALGTSTEAPHTVRHTFHSLGTRRLTARVEDSSGAISRQSITVQVVNTPPTVEIRRPSDGEEIFRGANVILRGSSRDPNESDFELDCSALRWSSDVAGDPLPQTGCEVEVAFPSNGARTVTLTGTDSHGATASNAVEIVVVDPPEVLPPEVRIEQPQDGSSVDPEEEIHFVGSASDPGGATDLDYAWFVTYDLGDGPQTDLMSTAESFTWTPAEETDIGLCDRPRLDIDLEVTNPDGSTGTDSIDLFVFRIC